MQTPAGGWPARSAGAARIVMRDAAAAAPWIGTAFVALWLLAFLQFSDGQWGDNLEQLVWAHGVEWGYHKHPPLPTWLLAAAIALAGPASWWPIVLAGLCTVATGWLTHRIARRLLGEPWATFAVLAWGLQQAFSMRASLFNHNTVMMLAVAATAWCVLEALQSRRELAWWLLAGVAAGAALLSKYQAIVPLAGVVVALWRSDAMREREVGRGLLLAVVVAAAVTAPHAAWLLSHEFGPLAYASQPGVALTAVDHVGSVVGFIAQQFRLLLPALVFCALVSRRGAPAHAGEGATSIDRGTRNAWLLGLVAFPFAATVASGPLLGLQLQNHWGFQSLQFAGLALAWALRARAPAPRSEWVATAAALHVVFVAIAVADMAPGDAPPSRRSDAGYPAHELATAVARDWQRVTTCPLRLVVGPSFEAGIVSAYNGGTADVLEDGEPGKSPWIDRDAALRDGAVYVDTDLARLPTRGAAIVSSLDVSDAAPPPFERVYWAVVPGERCEGSR